MLKGFLVFLLLQFAGAVLAEPLRIAAAADLRFALDEIVAHYRGKYPSAEIDVTYGSSGKFFTQIQNGAPFDLYFSADIALPRALADAGLIAGEVRSYGIGRIVLWAPGKDAANLTLNDLVQARFRRIAIANPKHAPYGARAVEALKASGLWSAIESRVIYGENIAQTAQFVQTGNASIGLIALSLAITPEFVAKGSYATIPAALHAPLEQGFAVIKRGAGKAEVQRFAQFFSSPFVRSTLRQYGFEYPNSP